MENPTESLFAKMVVFLLTLLVGVFGWMGKNIYDSTIKIDKRLTIVETTLLSRTEAVTRLSILEHRVEKLESNK